MKAHIQLLETTPEYQQQLLIGLEYLLNISYVEEPEVFKVCLDYWHVLVCDLFQSDAGGAEAGTGQPVLEFSFAPAGTGSQVRPIPRRGRAQA